MSLYGVWSLAAPSKLRKLENYVLTFSSMKSKAYDKIRKVRKHVLTFVAEKVPTSKAGLQSVCAMPTALYVTVIDFVG